MSEITTTPATEEKREMVSFTHYQTGEVREVAVPTKIQQVSQAYVSAFMTDVAHCADLPWYREMREAAYTKVKEENPSLNDADIKIRSFPQIRIAFAKKYMPEIAPKEKQPRAKKPEKLNMWEI